MASVGSLISTCICGTGISKGNTTNRYISSSYLNNPLHHKFSNQKQLLLVVSTSTSTILKSNGSTKGKKRGVIIRAAEKESSSSMATEIGGVKVIKNPPEAKLTELGVRSWPKWGCPPSKFPWTYSAKETCFLLKGKVKVYPDGANQAVEIGAGDLVEFPKGMSCTWDVSEEVDKHYNFE